MLLNDFMEGTYSCGNLGFDFPGTLPYMVSKIIVVIQILVPVLLIIFGMLDLAKAVIASKEDEIKKGQNIFLKRVIAALIVFFVILIVQVLVGFVSNKDSDIVSCMNCFINGDVAGDACVER